MAVLDHVKKPETRHSAHSDLAQLAAQTVFSVMDHLQKWIHHRGGVLAVRAQEAAAKARVSGSTVNGLY